MLRDGAGEARKQGGVNGDAGEGGAGADLSGVRAGLRGAGSGVAEAGLPAAKSRVAAAPSDAALLGMRRLGRAELLASCRDELVGLLGDIEQLSNRLAGYRVDVLGALESLSRSGVAPDAVPHQTLRDAAGISGRDARKTNRIAAKAREHASVLTALSDGHINPSQAEVLCDARVPDEVRTELLAGAGAEDTDATRRRVRQAESEHTRETFAERSERQRAARGAGWGRDHDGMFKLWARFDPETGARIEAALEPLRRAYWNNDKNQRSGRRTPAQRDADAIAFALAGVTLTDDDADAVAKLLNRASRRSRAESRSGASRRTGSGPISRGESRRDPSGQTESDQTQLGDAGPDEVELGYAAADDPLGYAHRLPPAQISVLIGFDALRGATDEAGLTDSGVELAPETVRRLACDSEIYPVILGGPGGPADIGRVRRTVPVRLRRLLVARDKHCRWPGCSVPASRCDAHHIIHWIHHGPTDLVNLVLLCHKHHQFLHEHGYRMVPQPDGTWTPAREPESRSAPQHAIPQPRAP